MSANDGLRVAERLYYAQQMLLEFTATVADIRLESRIGDANRWQIALDRTAFYPEGGGQPCDLGTFDAVARGGARLEVPVLGVLEEEGEVWHIVGKPLAVGTIVTGFIDGPRRRDHMQQHTGQHLLSAVFLELLGAPTLSFHLGAEVSTIDLAAGSLPESDLAAVEERANILIAEDHLISVSTVSHRAAEAMYEQGKMRKLPERSGEIRIVQIEGVEWNACGGTHVASTGAIGGLTIRNREHVKGGLRVEFCCGLRAIRGARRDFGTLSLIAGLLSSGPADLPAKVAGLLEESRSSAKARRTLLEEMAEIQARTYGGGGRVVESEARDPEYARLLASRVAAVHPDRVALVHAYDADRATIVLAAGVASGVRCGSLMRAALDGSGTRGGGSDSLAQCGVSAAQAGQLLAELRRLLL